MHPEDLDRAAREVTEALAGQEHYASEFRIVRPDGEIRHVQARASIVRDEHGTAIHMIGVNMDITERKAAERRIEELAYYDQLTGLPNRRLLLDRLDRALAHGHRAGQHGALLFVDLDHFKRVNDTAGHSAGDELLRATAGRLSRLLREEDTLSRLGGDEFLILLGDLGADAGIAAAHARIVAQKIAAAIREPVALSGAVHQCTASIGIALFGPGGGGRDELLKQADLAMYKAKEHGRNRTHFFDPRLQREVDLRAGIEADLRSALSGGQFSLHFQPVFDVSGRLLGAEALLRWHHPRRGWLAPREFIPVAEDCGMIHPIGDRVLRTACEQLAHWRQSTARRISRSRSISALTSSAVRSSCSRSCTR